MSRYVSFDSHPPLSRPTVVCAFQGWNDAGQAASVAARYLADGWGGRVIGRLDPEEFLDFQVTRPTVRMEGGVSRVVEWPSMQFRAASAAGRDFVVFVGVEPNNRWRTFTDAVLDAARDLGSDLLVTLGAFLTDVPHTRPVPVVVSAPTEEEAAALGLSPSQYEGPTGIVGVLHDRANRSGLRSLSVWAAAPHYLPAMPNPKVALAIVERTAGLLHAPVDGRSLAAEAARWEREVARTMEDNEELADYVRTLETAADEMGDGGAAMRVAHEVPSAEAIAAEVERFLREQSEGPGEG